MILDQIDEWEKKWYGKPRNMETGRRIGIVVYGYARNIRRRRIDFTFNALFIEEF
jgi:hypothetical protein